MHRRSFLSACAIGATSAAGCISLGRSRRPAATVSRVEMRYPAVPGSGHSVTAAPVESPDGTPTAVDALSEKVRLEAANAIVRDRYWTWRTLWLSYADLDDRLIEYEGETFQLWVSVGDVWEPPSHGSGTSSRWTNPLAVEAAATGEELTVGATNELDVPLDIRHLGRPYFGVLAAVGETVQPLHHDRYGTNEHIRTDGLVRTPGRTVLERQTETIHPGDALEETYEFGETLSGEAIIWFTIELAEDSLDLFRNGRTTARVRVHLHG